MVNYSYNGHDNSSLVGKWRLSGLTLIMEVSQDTYMPTTELAGAKVTVSMQDEEVRLSTRQIDVS